MNSSFIGLARGQWALCCALMLVGAAGLSRAAAEAWQQGKDLRWREVSRPDGGKTGFTMLPSERTGIHFANRLSPGRSLTNSLLNGSGVAAGDVDRDGWCDLFFARVDGSCVLYRNLGDWKFEDITAKAGVACAGQDSTGAALADVDGDGDLDLVVNALGHGTRIFENNGHGIFREVTVAAGVASNTGSSSMALADIDGDGDLDLYVANFRPNTVMDQPVTKYKLQKIRGKMEVTAVDDRPTTLPDLAGRFVVDEAGEVQEIPEADALYLNDGHGVFSPRIVHQRSVPR